ncbi:MAG: hypothetical protein ACWA41_00625 [Putridiphycobacter sp.]
MHNLNNYASGSHYANVRYNIVETRIGFGIGKKAKLIVADNLDANGHAELTIKMKAHYSYSLAFATPDNICYNDIPFEHLLDQNETNNVDFNYAPCGYVNVPTINVNCEGSTDKLWYKYYYSDNSDIYLYRGFTGVGDSVWDPNAGTEGCVNYIGDFYDKIPAGNYTFEWHIERPSGIVDGTDYFTVTEGDTTTYILEY